MEKLFTLRFLWKSLFTLIFAVSVTFLNAQSVSGVLTDENGDPLIGATVYNQTTEVGVVTDLDGSYEIEAKEGDVIIISYLGYKNQTVIVEDNKAISFAMAPDEETLGEIVVVGYGRQKKSHVSGSISKVRNEGLDQIPMSRMDDALVGQVAGVNIQANNPSAGEAPSIRVRGQGSISFDSNPLIVVDGIAVGTDGDFLSSLDMNDVESIEVLKDAASSAIYGSRGANGIIMITTKQGTEGPTKFSYNSYVGIKSVPQTDVLTTVSDWLSYVRENNEGELPDKLQYVEALQDAGVPETDWEDVMFDGGMIHSHSLAARGGSKNTKFRAAVSYLNDEGVLLTDNFEKLNFRLNLDTRVNDRVSLGIVLNPSYTEQRRFPIGVHDAVRAHAWVPIFLEENSINFVNRDREDERYADAIVGDYAKERMFDDYDLIAMTPSEGSGTDISGTSNVNPYAKVWERDRRKYQTKIFSNIYGTVNLTDDLFFKQSFGGDIRFTKNTRWQGVLAHRDGLTESFISNDDQTHLVSESTINFSKEMTNHEIDFVAGMAFEKWQRDFADIGAAGFEFDYIQTIPPTNVTSAQRESAEESLLSYLSRVNYAFKNRYFLSLSARWDGSSKFGPNNKFGFFPAASAAWTVSQENFLVDNTFIDNLKLRVSYGLTGSNAGIGEYDYIGLLQSVAANGETGFNPINISNSDLRWEKLREVNGGLDLSILDGKFGITLDVYNRTSEDLLLELPIPSVTGFDNALVNRGIVENRGYELEFRAVPWRTAANKWTTSALVTHNRNKLVDFAGASGTISTVDSKRPAEWIALEGYPIASYYGYVVDKEIPLEFIENPWYPINAQSQDIYVKDLNGDGLIDGDDRTILGSPYPDYIYSWNNMIKLGQFDVSFMLQGTQGAEIRNISSQYIKQEFSSQQDYNDEFEDAALVQQRIFTNDDIQDADYFAVRNFNIGYNFRNLLTKNFGVNNARLYVGAQNLLYVMSEGYEGYNPEGVDQGLGNPLTWGYQRGPAPIFRTVSAGINLEF